MRLQLLSYDCFLVHRENYNDFILFLLKILKKSNTPGVSSLAAVEIETSLMAP